MKDYIKAIRVYTDNNKNWNIEFKEKDVKKLIKKYKKKERPNKKDYDFNDIFEGVRFANNMIKYADNLEKQISTQHLISSNWIECENCGVIKNRDECVLCRCQ
tara:strand:- start:106 stop:414 length:309 start_codon:yes stop_codon:yes gene_type:complete